MIKFNTYIDDVVLFKLEDNKYCLIFECENDSNISFLKIYGDKKLIEINLNLIKNSLVKRVTEIDKQVLIYFTHDTGNFHIVMNLE